MRRAITALATAGVAAAALFTAAPAHASATAPTSGKTVAKPAFTAGCTFGDFCVGSSDSGGYYQFPFNSGAWPASIYNDETFVIDNGDPNAGAADVDIFYDTAAQGYGAYACIGYATEWQLSDGPNRYFSWSGYHGNDGQGQSIWLNAVAHHWVYFCGADNDFGF